ncbi:MAG TPA: LysM peptidoglycan-binding domain-containing protein [Rhodocyclaceae bacterium]|nr:LysM peptidoglycan-binding domain-containing protein [Rhodocyclaceae bacterium]
MPAKTTPRATPIARHLLVVLVTALCGSAAFAQDFVYVVRPGDNPWNLTQRYLKSIDYWPRIQDYNQILDPLTIRPGTVLRIPVAWMRGEAGSAHIVDMRGQVEQQVGDRTETLTTGARVNAGALIRSGEDSSLTLEFPDGSRSLVGANTELKLRELRRLKASGAQQLGIELRRGNIENTVRPVGQGGGRYIIHTPAAIAAVRGTDFRATVQGDRLRAETLEGEVALQNRRGTTRLPAGTGSQARRGQAPEASARLLPAPRLDGLPEVIDRLPFRLPIDPVPGAVRYRTQIATDSGFSALESDRSTSEPVVLGGESLADGSYRLRARATDGRGLEGLNGERTVVINARPEPPYPQAPGGFATEERVRFEWAHSAEATRYHFELAADANFERILVTRDDLTAPQLTLEDELPSGDYWWRVARSTAAEGRGPFSDPQKFRRPPPGPAAEPPEVDADVLKLRWRATDGAERYHVQLARSADFEAPEYSLETTPAELEMPRPPGGTWHVRIRSQAADSPPGPWGKPQQIEVPHSHWRALLILLPLLLAL